MKFPIVYVLLLKYVDEGKPGQMVEGVFNNKEDAERRGKGAVRNYPLFFYGYEVVGSCLH